MLLLGDPEIAPQQMYDRQQRHRPAVGGTMGFVGSYTFNAATLDKLGAAVRLKGEVGEKSPDHRNPSNRIKNRSKNK